MSGGRAVANEFPISRIKADMPEFCSLVALARLMSYNEMDLKETENNLRRILQLLMTVPTHELLPTAQQKTGVESLLYLTESLSESYATELDNHTKRMLNSIKAFNETVTEIERVKNEVVRKYAISIAQFEEIVELSGSSQVETQQTLKDLLLKVLDDQEVEEHQRVAAEEKQEEEKEAKEEKTTTTIPAVPPPIPPPVVVTTTTSTTEFQEFFSSNNASNADGETEASISGTPIISVDIEETNKEEPKEEPKKEEPKKEEKEEEEEEPKPTRRTTRRRRRTTTTSN